MNQKTHTHSPWRAVSRRLRVHRSWRFLRLRGAGGSLPCSPAVAAAAPTPPGDRRGGFDSPAGSCRRTFGAEHKLVPARRGQQLLVDQRKRSSPRRWLASGARTRCSIERGSLEVKFAVRHPRGDVSAPFLDVIQALTVLKSMPLLPNCRTQVSAPWRPISTTSRPRAYRMALQAHRHGQSVPRGVASAFVLTSRSLSFDRFYPSSLSFSALTRRSPALCARLQAASGSGSAR